MDITPHAIQMPIDRPIDPTSCMTPWVKVRAVIDQR